MAVAAASRTPLLRMVMGKKYWEIGERPPRSKGENRVCGKKGSEKAMHIRAFESAPPNAPEWNSAREKPAIIATHMPNS